MTCWGPVRETIRGGFAKQLGETEVGDLHAAFLVDQDVLGLDVAMDDAFIVGELQGIADLRHDPERFGGLQSAGPHRLAQIDAVHEFHDEITETAGLADIVNADNVRMAEHGERLGLAHEPFGKRGILAELRRQNLDCDQPVQAVLPRLVHRSHAALTQQFENLQMWKHRLQRFTRRRNESGSGRRRPNYGGL